MKRSHHLLAGLILASTALSSHAQLASSSKLYGELGYASIGLKASDGVDSAKATPGLLIGTVGYQLMSHLAIEGFAGFGLTKDEVQLNGADTGVNAKADSSFGIFLKPSLKATESVELFGRVGWARTKAALSVSGLSVSESDSDMAWGLGVNYHLSPTSYLQWGWTQLYDKDGLTARGWSLSYGHRF